MLKFIATDASTLGEKRKQVAKACESCRKRKKRCNHSSLPSESPTLSSPLGNLPTGASQSIVAQSPIGDGHDLRTSGDDTDAVSVPQAARHPRESSARLSPTTSEVPVNDNTSTTPPRTVAARFVGDLNPESVFLAANQPQNAQNQSQTSVGFWHASRRHSWTQYPASNAEGALSPDLFSGVSMVAQQAMIRIFEEFLATIPPPASIRKMTSFYIDKIHPILPLLDYSTFRHLSTSSPAYVLLQQGICLVASMNPAMRDHLYLNNVDGRLTYDEFAKRIFAAMRALTESNLVQDKITLIQAHAMMWMFMDGPNARDVSSAMCGRAVQYTQSLGLHLESENSQEGSDYRTMLLMCVWAIDRLNAAIHGRPALMNERDFSKDFMEYIDDQSSCFKLFLLVAFHLDKVIGTIYLLKRISSQPITNYELPAFEDLLEQANVLQAPIYQLATVEVFYHAVSMLACRSRTSVPGHRHTLPHLRQTVAAERVSSLVGNEYHDQLVHLPFVPYAVSLSLSIAYTELRHTNVPMYRIRAREKLQRNCDILQELGQVFYLASVMADMALATLKEYDRIYSNIRSTNSRSRPEDDQMTKMIERRRSTHHQDRINQSEFSNESDWDGFEDEGSDSTSFLDLDIFGMFDPEFDLDSMDMHLEGNLNPGFPTRFQ